MPAGRGQRRVGGTVEFHKARRSAFRFFIPLTILLSPAIRPRLSSETMTYTTTRRPVDGQHVIQSKGGRNWWCAHGRTARSSQQENALGGHLMEDMSEEEIRGLERSFDAVVAEERREGGAPDYWREDVPSENEQFSITDAPDSRSQKTLRQYLSRRFPNDARFQ